MKKTSPRVLLSLLLFSLILTVSCSSDDNSEAPDEEYLTATIDGNSFASSLSVNMTQNMGVTTIGGTSSNNHSLMLQLSDNSPGTYLIGGENSSNLTIASYTTMTGSGVEAWQAPINHNISSGQIIISNSSDHNIKGTFNFTATNPDDNTTVEVTNGKFNINF